MKPSHWPYNIRRFFGDITLIEVLVILAIIAILAAMLVPALAKAKQREEQRKQAKTVQVEKPVTIEVGDTVTVLGLDRKGIVNYIADNGFMDILVEGTNGGAPNLLKGVNPKLIRK